MRIAYLSSFHPYRGGISQFNALLFRALEKKHEVKAFNFKHQYPSFLFPGRTQLVSQKDKVDVVNSKSVLNPTNPISYIKTAREIRQFHPDLLITRYWMSFFSPALSAVISRMKRGVKAIGIIDNIKSHESRWFDQLLTNHYLDKLDGAICMSKSVESEMIKIKHNQPESTVLQHPDYHQFGSKKCKKITRQKLGLHANKKTLLFFGFIRPYKGLDTLLDTFKNLDSSYQLVIAGECYGSFNSYQKQIDKLPNPENVHLFLRYLANEDVGDFFSAADVCILPYKKASQSGVGAIALHFNLPTIVTDAGGLQEMLLDGKFGLTTPKSNPQALGTAIGRYFENGLQQKLSQQIEERTDKFTWDNFADHLVDFSSQLS